VIQEQNDASLRLVNGPVRRLETAAELLEEIFE
jgi:uncharacterized protein YuzB (UPF0349 family)